MSVPAELIAGLEERYSEPQRHYHSWAHVEALLRHFEDLRGEFSEADLVLWALYYHDVIYDPKEPDNEEQSAELLKAEAADYLSSKDLRFTYDIIIGTKRHERVGEHSESRNYDMALFLDIDLSILAAPLSVFDEYELNIRKEYAFVPEEAFRKGRGDILKTFLNRPRIYYSDVCYDRWEAQARANLERSVERLTP